MTAAKTSQKAAPLEWLAAALSLAIFITLFAIILGQTIDKESGAVPDLVVDDQRLILTSNGSLVEFTIHNRSGQTAAAVVVEGNVSGTDGQSTPSSVTIDYVPARSRVTAGLIFPGDVRGRKIEIRPVAYRRP